jgi:hypothetical protein
MMTYTCPVRPRVGKLLENGVGHIREKRVGKLPEKSGPKVGHFPENSHLDGDVEKADEDAGNQQDNDYPLVSY